MFRTPRLLSLSILLTAALGCASATAPAPATAPRPGQPPATDGPAPTAAPQLYAVAWQQIAAEYDASAHQAYALARAQLAAALADPAWTAATEQEGQDLAGKPPAVVLDIDETVLDNGPSAAREILWSRPHNDADWDVWVQEAAAEALAGTAEFLRDAEARGVAIFYVTNRTRGQHAATAENLHRLGLPIDPERLLVKDPERGWGSDKTSRRTEIAKTHRILLLVGDDLNDFVAAGGKSPAERDAIVRETAARWGRDWILLPNPVYGSWERALLVRDGRRPANQVERRQWIVDALDPGAVASPPSGP